MSIGEKIRKAREEKGITQAEAAERLMVSRQTVSNWENERSLPDILSVMRMSELYKLSLDELLKGDRAMMNKIEKDMKMSRAEKKILKLAGVSILLGVIVFALGKAFIGSPVVEFLEGATPWVLLGLTYLFWLLSMDKQGDNKKSRRKEGLLRMGEHFLSVAGKVRGDGWGLGGAAPFGRAESRAKRGRPPQAGGAAPPESPRQRCSRKY